MDNLKSKKKIKSKKPKKKAPTVQRRQKQKQNVKQYVKVNVQTQGGSGGGGSSSSLPQSFRDRSGENVVLMNLIEQLGKQFKQPQAQPQTIIQRVISTPIERIDEIPVENDYNPSNDFNTLNNVFNTPNNNDMSIGERLNEDMQPQTEAILPYSGLEDEANQETWEDIEAKPKPKGGRGGARANAGRKKGQKGKNTK